MGQKLVYVIYIKYVLYIKIVLSLEKILETQRISEHMEAAVSFSLLLGRIILKLEGLWFALQGRECPVQITAIINLPSPLCTETTRAE